jgi:hypothetical protein
MLDKIDWGRLDGEKLEGRSAIDLKRHQKWKIHRRYAFILKVLLHNI